MIIIQGTTDQGDQHVGEEEEAHVNEGGAVAEGQVAVGTFNEEADDDDEIVIEELQDHLAVDVGEGFLASGDEDC